jgi:hypothetical protein
MNLAVDPSAVEMCRTCSLSVLREQRAQATTATLRWMMDLVVVAVEGAAEREGRCSKCGASHVVAFEDAPERSKKGTLPEGG